MSLVGKDIGRYHVIEQLGQGGMAIVYKAFDTRLERDVAIKVIRTENILPSKFQHFLQRFKREAKAQAQFDHPNIVPVFDYGEFEGAPYLVMTYEPGGTLKQLLKSPMPYQQAAQLLIPIADALAYAHHRDVLHRDVKPSNILLGDGGKPVLTDFGIAKLLGDEEEETLTGTGMGVGTPQYMAPEQWKGEPVKATDIYSLGIVFYELIAGRKPYDADTPAALAIMQVTEPLPRPSRYVPDLPEAVEKVIFKALATEPEDRYASMEDFRDALLAICDCEDEADWAKSSQRLAAVGVDITKEFQDTPILEPQSELQVEMKSDRTPPPAAARPKTRPPDSKPYIKRPVSKPTKKKKFRIPGWGWGLIIGGVLLGGFFIVVIAGVLVLGNGSMAGGDTPTPEITATEIVETPPVIQRPTTLPTHTMAPTLTATITVLPTATFTITPTFTPTAATGPLVGGGGGKIAFSSERSGNSDIWVIDTNGGNLVQLTDSTANDLYPSWSPDGSRIVFQSSRSGNYDIWVMDADGSNLEQITSTEANEWYPSFSPDGSMIVFSSDESGNWDIWRIDANGDHQFQLTDDVEDDDWPAWSPDGRKIAFASHRSGNWDIWAMNPDGSGQTQITTDESGDNYPTWSPDSTKIAFHTHRDGIVNIWVINADGTDPYPLNDDSPTENLPSWSPDGQYIAFHSDRTGNWDIWLLNVETGELTQLTTDDADDSRASWMP